MKERQKINTDRIKILASRLLQFIICNVAVIVFGAVAIMIMALLGYEKMVEHQDMTNLTFGICMAIGFIIPFYLWYFGANSEYKRFYLKNSEAGHSKDKIMQMHINTFGKYEFYTLLIVTVILAIMPIELINKYLSFLFSSAMLFVDNIPNLLDNTSFIIRLIGWLIWDVYIVGMYLVCLKISHITWEKTKLRK